MSQKIEEKYTSVPNLEGNDEGITKEIFEYNKNIQNNVKETKRKTGRMFSEENMPRIEEKLPVHPELRGERRGNNERNI